MQESFALKLDYLVFRVTWAGWNIGPRTISNYELVFVTAGQGKIAWEESAVTAKPGDLICFYPGVRHQLWVDADPCMEFYGLHFTPAPGFALPALPRLLSLPSPHLLQPLFQQLLEDYRNPPYLAAWKQDILLQQILYQAALQLRQSDSPAETVRIRRVIQLIRQDPGRTFTLDQLTEAAHLKKTAFLEAFRRVTGTTPGRYMMQFRLEQARDMLLNTDLSVSEIAARCGFSDPFYFSRCFSRQFSLPPSRYRSQRL